MSFDIAPPPELWDESARAYDQFERKWRRHRTVAEGLIQTLEIKPDSRVLELACGTGACTLLLSSLCPHGEVVALERSSGMLEIARRNAEAAGTANVSFMIGDASKLSELVSGRERFDFVVSNCGFWYLDNPAHVLRVVHTLLRPQGQLAFNLPALSSREEKSVRRKLTEMLSRLGNGHRLLGNARPRLANYLDLLAQTGFRVVRDAQCEFEMAAGLMEEWRRIPVFSLTGPARLVQRVLDAMRWLAEAWPSHTGGGRSRWSAWRVIVAARAN